MTQHTSLFEVLARHEGVDTEYKAARGGLPKSLWETYSAFANTAGGTIYLGVKEGDEGPSTASLTEADVDKLRGEFWVTLNNSQKVSANILQEHHVSVETYQGDAILVIEVPRASRSERPVYIGVDPFKGSYRRNHEGDFRCNEAEVQRMFADRLDQEPADSRILEYFGFDDLDPASLKQYRNRMASRAPNHAWLTEDDLGLLKKLGGWRKDRRTQQEGLTVAGLLMFGQTQAIQDPLAVPGFHLDYRERLAEDDDIRWSDRLTIDGTWEANLFQFYQRVVQKLGYDPALKVPYRPDRRAQSDAHEALTEALVNALIHADHIGQGGIVVERFKERFEFSNPGTLLLSQEQLLAGGVTECRNKSLQLMFQLLGVGDKAGSGLDKIRRSWHAHLWQPPSLKETLRPDRVILTLPLISVMPEDVMARLQQRFGQAFKDLSPDEAQTLVIAALEQQVTNRRLQEMLTLHRVDITQMLSGLVEKGMLVPHGRSRGAYYTLPLMAPTGLKVEAVPSPRNGEQHQAGSLHSDTSSPHSDTSSLHYAEPGHPVWEELVQQCGVDTAASLRAETAHVRGHRPSGEEIRRVLKVLCQGRYLSLAQLAYLMGRNPEGLRTRYLTPMVREGQLQLRYPNVPNHSRQGYRTVKGITA
ncbi:ATP-binding protein [Ectothiorhodospira mobilis]|uniref:ATP-binding protein n=1 Tax=Ectothiorhodospira mobilis TaxID=195064 RepID=UPI001EE79858|nr:RNA-binding domain-containing protein [Ectothiorhodospira mobilis]MCG5534889.1 putative DNA binding domain-containing protein [Ectothiorhodospira mobilis]